MDIVDAKDKTTLFLQRVENVSTAGQPRLLSGGETAMDTTSAMLAVVNHHHHHLDPPHHCYLDPLIIIIITLMNIYSSFHHYQDHQKNHDHHNQCAGLYYKMNGQNRPLIKPKRRLVS